MRRNFSRSLLIVSLGILGTPLWAQSGTSLQFRSADATAPATSPPTDSTPSVSLGKAQPAVKLGTPRAYTARAQTPDTTLLLATAVGQEPFAWIMPSETTTTCQPNRIWGSVEYLLFWFKDQNVPIPMVTAAPAGAVNGGAINGQNTAVLFGNQDIDFQAANGMRLTFGGWLDGTAANYGIEGSGFVFERKAHIYNFATNGTATLALPYFSLSTNQESALPVGQNLFIVPPSPGQVEVSSNIKLWGAEVNGVINLTRTSGLDADMIAGVRYLDLAEGLYLSAARQGTGAFILQDSFATSNHFLGGQIGARVTGTWDRFFGTAALKVAIGGTKEKIEIDGYRVNTPPGAPSNGGLYAQASNSGQFTRTSFAFVPDLDLKVGVKITQNFRATVGYNIMWISNVVRPGDQLDRNINVTQNPAYGVAPTGPRGPNMPFNDTSFWAQGVTAGLEFLY